MHHAKGREGGPKKKKRKGRVGKYTAESILVAAACHQWFYGRSRNSNRRGLARDRTVPEIMVTRLQRRYRSARPPVGR
jgi:hypothetical protein